MIKLIFGPGNSDIREIKYSKAKCPCVRPSRKPRGRTVHLIKYHAVKTLIQHILTPCEHDLSAPRSGAFATGEKAPSTHWTGGQVHLIAGPVPSENRTPVVQPVALSLYWLSYPSSFQKSESWKASYCSLLNWVCGTDKSPCIGQCN
jgi:hypothetical protein